jgi:hypothetical protein
MPTLYLRDLGISFEGFSFSLRGENSYWKGEEKILAPQLVAKGFKIIGNWYTTDGDGFGPLSRGVQVEKDGVISVAWYG